MLFYFLLTDIITSRKGLWRIADFFLAAAVFVGFIGIWQFFTDTNTLVVEGVSRVFGVYQHPNNLALYLGRALPFAACVGLFLPWGWRKIFYLLASVPLAITLFLTYSRGSWIGVTVGVAVAIAIGLWWKYGSVRPRLTRRSWATLGVGCVLVLAIAIARRCVVRIPEAS